MLKQKLEVFYDGGCPLCSKEIAMLQKWDRNRRIRFVNIADGDFRATEFGKTYDELMSRLQARLADGKWITGVEVFRQMYSRLGFRFLVRLTRLPVISLVLDMAYRFFASNRLRWTQRCTSACVISAERT